MLLWVLFMRNFLPSLVVSLVVTGFCWAAPANPVLDISPGDVSLVQIELTPDAAPKVVVHFSNSKLLELEQIILANYGKPVSFVSNGKIVVEPLIQSQLLHKRRTVSLRFPDLKSASLAADQLMVK